MSHQGQKPKSIICHLEMLNRGKNTEPGCALVGIITKITVHYWLKHKLQHDMVDTLPTMSLKEVHRMSNDTSSKGRAEVFSHNLFR